MKHLSFYPIRATVIYIGKSKTFIVKPKTLSQLSVRLEPAAI